MTDPSRAICQIALHVARVEGFAPHTPQKFSSQNPAIQKLRSQNRDGEDVAQQHRNPLRSSLYLG